MATYGAEVHWERKGESFADNRYSRAHTWRFDGGQTVPASASPHIVPFPMSDPAAVDPEEAFVASLASCHMLFFLSFAARDGWTVESYTDDARGTMENGPEGMWMSRVELRPLVRFEGTQPSSREIDDLHHRSHAACFLARSVRSEIRLTPR
ncbi:MAG: OsmC family protein [Rhodothermales bacterium]|nr:OsmC family protein [Rhodothermales bacterium]